MKRRLLLLAVLAAALSLPLAKSASAQRGCYEESYGGGSCGTLCIFWNDQGSVEGWSQVLHAC